MPAWIRVSCDVAAHHPFIVSLSCVAGYTTQSASFTTDDNGDYSVLLRLPSAGGTVMLVVSNSRFISTTSLTRC